jgi:hypothetical protein
MTGSGAGVGALDAPPVILAERGIVLDILVQGRRDGAAARCFFKHLLHGCRTSHDASSRAAQL